MKKFAALAVAGCMAVSLAACGGSASAPASSEAASTESAATSAAESAAESVTEATQGGKVGVCIYKFDDAFMTTYRNALQEILEGKGYEVTIVDGNNDQAKQNEQINTFITQGVDALIINPVMTSAADQIISTVKDADVPTVLINREPTADQMSAYDKLVYVGCDAAQSGTFQGELILDTENKGDINGDGTVNADDCTIIGRGQPLHTGGFNNTFEFFGFDLNVFFQWNYGNDILNAARTQFVRGKSEVGYNRWKEYCGRWTPENPMSDIPRVGGWGSSQYSTFEVEDGSFLRLKNLSLGYTLPSKITKKFFVQKLRVYFSAQNLVTWSDYSGYDPEVSTKNTALTPGYDWSAYPRSRVYNFGINVVF